MNYIERMNNIKASEIIDALGGTVATAKLLKYSKQRVSNWRRTGIPNEVLTILCLKYRAKLKDVEDKQSAALR
jgi:hypothetical protein